MILCRSCHRISTGDPKFCVHCGKSFNATICPAKHESPASATHCATCGSDELSTPTLGTRLSLPNRLLAAIIGLGLLWLLTPAFPGLLGVIFKVLGWVFCTIFAPILWMLVKLILPFLIVWGVIGVMLQIVTGEKVSPYRVYLAISRRLADALMLGLRLLGVGLLRLVFSRRKRE